MKRRLNENDVPEAITPPSMSLQSSFTTLGLDGRLLQAISQENYVRPTAIQAAAIPPAIEGKDVLARARTGTGKTAAYLLPILHSILQHRTKQGDSQNTRALILVPTRELASQVQTTITSLTAFCGRAVQAVNLTSQIQPDAQRALLASRPDIVVSTPARALVRFNSGDLDATRLANLIVDEADLLYSYGYKEDFRSIAKLLPSGIQLFFASATLTTEVASLTAAYCRNPVVIDLQEEEKTSIQLRQYVIKCTDDDKFMLAFALFKLKLIKGKCITFVGDVDRCYRLKLFLEQFGIRSCILNSELPVNCRLHAVEDFNKNVYDIIIASDEGEILGSENFDGNKDSNSSFDLETPNKFSSAIANTKTAGNKKRGGGLESDRAKRQNRYHKSDRNYGVSRGIDFQNVTCVLNFDLPSTARSYTHRIGRAARNGRAGVVMSFLLSKPRSPSTQTASIDLSEKEKVAFSEIVEDQQRKNQEIEAYDFDMEKLEGFRYRVASALKIVSTGAVREARIAEIRQEMLKSEKLKRHLEHNPEDDHYLRHDTEIRPNKVQSNLKNIPDYLIPQGTGQRRTQFLANIGQGDFTGPERTTKNRIRAARARNKGKAKKGAARKADPLRSFNPK